MKKSLVTLIFCFVTVCAALAQTSKGTISLGGAIGITSATENFGGSERKTTDFQFIPSAGYFLADRMELGLDLSLQTSNDKVNGQDAGSQSAIAAGPYFKYYMFTENENFAFTLRASALFGSTKTNPANSNSEATTEKGSNMQIAISPGFTYFLTHKIGLDFTLQGIAYQTTDPNKDVDNDNTSEFIFGVQSFSPMLGFRYFIGH